MFMGVDFEAYMDFDGDLNTVDRFYSELGNGRLKYFKVAGSRSPVKLVRHKYPEYKIEGNYPRCFEHYNLIFHNALKYIRFWTGFRWHQFVCNPKVRENVIARCRELASFFKSKFIFYAPDSGDGEFISEYIKKGKSFAQIKEVLKSRRGSEVKNINNLPVLPDPDSKEFDVKVYKTNERAFVEEFK